MSKRSTDHMHTLDIRKIARAGLLTPGNNFSWSWTRGGRQTASISIFAGGDSVTLDYRVKQPDGTWQPMNYAVRLDRTSCNYGGQRIWWLCPHCSRRVAVLWGGRKYACRHCHDLAYESTRTAPDSKAFARADKLRKRLGWVPGVAHGIGDRPKGMHWKTYLRLLQQYTLHANDAFAESSVALDRLRGKLGRINLPR